MNYMTNDLQKISQVFFIWLNTVSIARGTMMGRTYENNKMKCNLFMLVDILNINFKFVLLGAFFCYNNLFFTYVIFN